MDRKELISKLQAFKQACYDKGYIEDGLYLEDAYPGLVPTSFIVFMIAKEQWLDTVASTGTALDQLVDVLWETTDAKTRENIFTLSIYRENERHLLELRQLKESA